MNHADVISDLLKPYDARLMRCYPVSTRINHVANDDVECSASVEAAPDSERPLLVAGRSHPAIYGIISIFTPPLLRSNIKRRAGRAF